MLRGEEIAQAIRVAKQLLSIFLELLEEVIVSWKDCPFSSRSPIQGDSSLNFEGMGKHALMPPMEQLVTAHLHLGLAMASSRTPRIPSK